MRFPAARRAWGVGAPVLVLVMGAALAGCGETGDGAGGGGGTPDAAVRAVAAFYPVAEAVEQVGGDRVSVTNLTPAGAEPHDLELTTDQVDLIQDADVVFVMGNGFQPAVEEAARDRDGPTVELLERLPIDATGKRVEDEHADEGGAKDEHAEGSEADVVDPHVWLDPVLYGEMVAVIEGALRDVDPDGASAYATNAAAFGETVAAVDAQFSTALASCTRRTLVTAHDAFGWMAQRYDLEAEPIAGVSPEDEPSPARMAELADLVEDRGITTIFTEELVSPRVAQALAREAGGVRTAVLNPIEGLTDEQLDAGDDWESVMLANLDALVPALACTES